jgi:hypothetical protein
MDRLLEKPSKSFRSVKLRKRVNNLRGQEEDVAADFLLEKEGDVTDFLKPRNSGLNSSLNSEGLTRSFVGIVSARPRKESQSLTKKATILNKKRRLESERDPKETFKQMLEKINCYRLASLQEEKRRVRENKRSQVETHFQAIKSFQTMSKYWKNLENSIAIKSRKRENELLYTKQKKLRTLTNSPNKYFDKEQVQEKFSWYMNLRDSNHNRKVEAFFPVSSPGSNIFTRVSIFKEEDPKSQENSLIKLEEEDYQELQIIGVQKLPLEIQAVHRVGPEHLKTHQSEALFEEEVIAEHYDPWVKARLM